MLREDDRNVVLPLTHFTTMLLEVLDLHGSPLKELPNSDHRSNAPPMGHRSKGALERLPLIVEPAALALPRSVRDLALAGWGAPAFFVGYGPVPRSHLESAEESDCRAEQEGCLLVPSSEDPSSRSS